MKYIFPISFSSSLILVYAQTFVFNYKFFYIIQNSSSFISSLTFSLLFITSTPIYLPPIKSLLVSKHQNLIEENLLNNLFLCSTYNIYLNPLIPHPSFTFHGIPLDNISIIAFKASICQISKCKSHNLKCEPFLRYIEKLNN